MHARAPLFAQICPEDLACIVSYEKHCVVPVTGVFVECTEADTVLADGEEELPLTHAYESWKEVADLAPHPVRDYLRGILRDGPELGKRVAQRESDHFRPRAVTSLRPCLNPLRTSAYRFAFVEVENVSVVDPVEVAKTSSRIHKVVHLVLV